MEILTRAEFRQYWDLERSGMSDSRSPLWEPERLGSGGPSEWFVLARVPHMHDWDWDKKGYWSWVRRHCQGTVRCYSLNGSGEGWWGFERRDDILLWSLRWVG